MLKGSSKAITSEQLGLSMSLNLASVFMWSGKPKGDLQALYLSGAILSPDCVSLVILKPENDNQCHNVKKSAEEPVNLIDSPTYITWTTCLKSGLFDARPRSSPWAWNLSQSLIRSNPVADRNLCHNTSQCRWPEPGKALCNSHSPRVDVTWAWYVESLSPAVFKGVLPKLTLQYYSTGLITGFIWLELCHWPDLWPRFDFLLVRETVNMSSSKVVSVRSKSP